MFDSLTLFMCFIVLIVVICSYMIHPIIGSFLTINILILCLVEFLNKKGVDFILVDFLHGGLLILTGIVLCIIADIQKEH